jgi:hypothetical protein
MKDGDIEHAHVMEGYPGSLEMDAAEWLPYVEEFDISEEQKIELLQMLWNIMSTFVDIGWGVDSIQNFIPALKEFSSVADSGNAKMKIHTQQFNGVAKEDAAQKGSGDGISEEG